MATARDRDGGGPGAAHSRPIHAWERTVEAMRRLTLALPLLVAAAVSPAAATDMVCLSQGDWREAVSANRVVSPVLALRAARQAASGADVTRAQLCRRGEILVYIMVVLRPDGRFVEVTIDAASGRVAAYQ
jgi:uncharacterized membrane protein YkoI